MSQLGLDLGETAPIESSVIRRWDEETGTLGPPKRAGRCGCVTCSTSSEWRGRIHAVVVEDRGLLYCPDHAPWGAREKLAGG